MSPGSQSPDINAYDCDGDSDDDENGFELMQLRDDSEEREEAEAENLNLPATTILTDGYLEETRRKVERRADILAMTLEAIISVRQHHESRPSDGSGLPGTLHSGHGRDKIY